MFLEDSLQLVLEQDPEKGEEETDEKEDPSSASSPQGEGASPSLMTGIAIEEGISRNHPSQTVKEVFQSSPLVLAWLTEHLNHDVLGLPRDRQEEGGSMNDDSDHPSRQYEDGQGRGGSWRMSSHQRASRGDPGREYGDWKGGWRCRRGGWTEEERERWMERRRRRRRLILLNLIREEQQRLLSQPRSQPSEDPSGDVQQITPLPPALLERFPGYASLPIRDFVPPLTHGQIVQIRSLAAGGCVVSVSDSGRGVCAIPEPPNLPGSLWRVEITENIPDSGFSSPSHTTLAGSPSPSSVSPSPGADGMMGMSTDTPDREGEPVLLPPAASPGLPAAAVGEGEVHPGNPGTSVGPHIPPSPSFGEDVIAQEGEGEEGEGEGEGLTAGGGGGDGPSAESLVGRMDESQPQQPFGFPATAPAGGEGGEEKRKGRRSCWRERRRRRGGGDGCGGRGGRWFWWSRRLLAQDPGSPIEPGQTVRLRSCLTGQYLRITSPESVDAGGRAGAYPHFQVQRCPINAGLGKAVELVDFLQAQHPEALQQQQGKQGKRRSSRRHRRSSSNHSTHSDQSNQSNRGSGGGGGGEGRMDHHPALESSTLLLTTNEGQQPSREGSMEDLEPLSTADPRDHSRGEGSQQGEAEVEDEEDTATSTTPYRNASSTQNGSTGGKKSTRSSRHRSRGASQEQQEQQPKQEKHPTQPFFWSLQSVRLRGCRIGFTEDGLPDSPARTSALTSALSFHPVDLRSLDLELVRNELGVSEEELRVFQAEKQEFELQQAQEQAEAGDDDQMNPSSSPSSFSFSCAASGASAGENQPAEQTHPQPQRGNVSGKPSEDVDYRPNRPPGVVLHNSEQDIHSFRQSRGHGHQDGSQQHGGGGGDGWGRGRRRHRRRRRHRFTLREESLGYGWWRRSHSPRYPQERQGAVFPLPSHPSPHPSHPSHHRHFIHQQHHQQQPSVSQHSSGHGAPPQQGQ